MGGVVDVIEDIVEGATGWTKDLPIFGGTLGQYDGTLPDSVTSCDTSAFKCGPPTVEIFFIPSNSCKIGLYSIRSEPPTLVRPSKPSKLVKLEL